MAIQNKPFVEQIDNDKIWKQDFNLFIAKVFVPKTDLPGDVINFGYSAPYFLIFTESELSNKECAEYASKLKLKEIAASYDSSVVFINPKNTDGWKTAPTGIFEEIIENSKIHQYHEDGIAILNNRFFNRNDGFAIRGAIFRTCLIGKGDAADYIATNLLKTMNGIGLWGPADITPTVCVLEELSVTPCIERKDIPLVSINNSPEINKYISENTEYSLIQEQADFPQLFHNFTKQFTRWGWEGKLQFEPDLNALEMLEETSVVELKTSSDNSGDDAGTKTHKVGYISYYNKNLFDDGPVPLMLCFHGGGDSAKHIAFVSEWYKVAHDHNFLLVCVENHINSTATEMMELLEILKKQYNIDDKRIYASGFSMGGCKTWDLFQEYPEAFAGLAPMCATFELGLNVYGKTSAGYKGSGKINENIAVPVFYVGGEKSPLPELPFQAEKCFDRMKYILKVNNCKKAYDISFADKDSWENKIFGIGGDKIEVVKDESRNAQLTLHYFISQDEKIRTVFGSVDNQEHECRYHSCEQAWIFLSQFRR
ncbi:MAG: hypothetical protein MJ188_03005 [Treponema sp.]|nr:hypothetical protein [Treponema sp.]